MKNCYAIVTLLFSLWGHSQFDSLYSSDRNQRDHFLESVKCEDASGRQVFDPEQKRQILLERFRRRDAASAAARLVSLTPVPLCNNGTFEEFDNTSQLANFAYVTGNVLNPMQCRDLQYGANQGIPQYTPANNSLMATTVPSNHLDPYIGNIGAFDQYALKINYHDSYTSLSKVQAKRYKTDNETQLKFNYKAVLQSIDDLGHDNEQPFFKARVLNASGAVIDEFCLIGTPSNCIFKQADAMESDAIILYTPNWQSGILDISSLANNEVFTVEFIASRCGLGAHFGYAYVDDICLLHSDENLQGSITLDPLYAICPALPIQVCGTFTVPNSNGISATVQSLTLRLRNASNAVVFTTAVPVSLDLTNKTFCFELAAADFPDVTNMGYNVAVTIQYGLLQTECTGTNFDVATDDDANPGYDIWFLNCANCPIDLHTASLFKCDADHNGSESFNLQLLDAMVVGGTAGLAFSYFTTIADAVAETNAITTPAAYVSGSRSLYVRVSSAADCFKIIAVQLIVKNPSATISGILNVCSGSTTLTASPGASYLWSDGGTSASINATAIGSYSVTITDSYGCQSTASVNIPSSQVAAQPDIELTQPSCFSDFGSITITSPATEYSFDNGVTWVTTPTVSGLPVGSYVVLIKTVMNCISYPVTVQLVPFFSTRPTVTTEHPAYCGDLGSITVESTGTAYSFDNGVTWTSQNTMTDLPSGIYQVRVMDANGCISNATSVELYGQFLAAPDYLANNPYCGNLGGIEILTPAALYSIDGGVSWQTSAVFGNLAAGSYLVKIKNDLGCISPNVYVYLTNLESTHPSYQIVPPGCGTYGSVTITTPADEYSFDNGISWTTDPVMPNLGSPQTFVVKVRRGGCQSLSSYVNFYGNFLPLPVVQNYVAFLCDEANDGNEIADLRNWESHLVASVTGLSFRYFTDFASADTNGNANEIFNPSAYAVNAASHVVYVRVTDFVGCHSVAELQLEFLATPIMHMFTEYPLCVGKTVTVFAGVYDAYLWSTGETTPAIVIAQDGNYSVTVYENHLTANGWQQCETTHQFHVFWSDKAVILQIDTHDWTNYHNSLTALIGGIGSYEFSLDNETFQDSPTFDDLLSGEYTVYVRDKFGCGTVQMDGFLLMYPKFFTPNGDGFNDFWQIKLSKTEPQMVVRIFDRHGKFITEVDPLGPGWDGTYNGKPLPSTDYWFTVIRQDGTEYKEHFSMKR